MFYLKYMNKKNHNFFKITNISLLFRSFINVKLNNKASEKKRNICDFKEIICCNDFT